MAKRILHLGDLHLSEIATMGGAAQLDPETGANLAMRDIVEAVGQVVTSAGELDGIVIAGDLFDRPRPTPNELREAKGLLAFLARSCAAGRVLLIPGNHDLPRNPAEASALEGITGLSTTLVVEAPQVVEYAGLLFGCIPYPRRAAYREVEGVDGSNAIGILSAALTTCALGLKAQGADILVAHATIGGATVGAQPRTIEGDIEISRDALDAFSGVLLGHIHQQQIIRNAAYSGSPTIQDFGEEGERKGGILWKFHGDGCVERVPILTKGRLWQTIDFGAVDIDIADQVLADLPLEPGCVFRVRGELPHDVLQAVRARLVEARAVGAFVQDELRLLTEDRCRDRDIGQQGLDEAEILRRALVARQVPEEAHARLIDLHVHVAQGGAA